jgi:hypothetical protein
VERLDRPPGDLLVSSSLSALEGADFVPGNNQHLALFFCTNAKNSANFFRDAKEIKPLGAQIQAYVQGHLIIYHVNCGNE